MNSWIYISIQILRQQGSGDVNQKNVNVFTKARDWTDFIEFVAASINED